MTEWPSVHDRMQRLSGRGAAVGGARVSVQAVGLAQWLVLQ